MDEIHRFNKAQQDAFLPYVERGTIRLIGATTENPSFEINAALLIAVPGVYAGGADGGADGRRCWNGRLTDAERGLGASGVEADEEALATIASVCEWGCAECAECAGGGGEAGGGARGER